LARADPRLEAAVLATTSFDLLRERIAGIPAASSFLAGWDEFLDAHGHHARGEIELAKARWVETPDEILCQLQGLLRAPVDADFLARFEGLSSVRILAEAEVRRRLGFIRRKVFGVTLRKARRFLPLRENYKNQLVRGLWLLRRLFLEMGARLVEAGTLRSPDDVFFLELEEFHSLCGSGLEASEARRLVGERRASYERDRASEPRPIVYVGGDLPVPEACPTRSAGTVLRGIGVHPGVVRGPARVILRSGEDSLRPGEILVAPFTDPGWTPYFLSAAAIVVDTGGILSHGSIVAREFGIPTAVNVGPATTSILTGQLIEVDGTRGTVRILEPGEDPSPERDRC
jgi:pyruvate,water dikinase